jgi:hypothetical protein
MYPSMEFPMSKRKPAKASKPARSRKPAATAQRASQAVIRSPKPRRLRSVAPTSAGSSPELHNGPDAPVVEKPATALPILEKPAIASQNDSQGTISDNDRTKAFDVFSATANVGAYTKLPEIALANMRLAFELVQRLAQIKSPFEIPGVVSELTIRQFATLQSLVFRAR